MVPIINTDSQPPPPACLDLMRDKNYSGMGSVSLIQSLIQSYV